MEVDERAFHILKTRNGKEKKKTKVCLSNLQKVKKTEKQNTMDL